MKEESKKKKILRISGLIGLFLIVFGLSYALFTITLNGTKKVKISTGRLELQLLDSSNNPIYTTGGNNTTSYEINLDNQVPVSDEVGLDSTAFEFKLKNSGSVKASYTIYLDDVALESGESRIDDEYIRYSLTKNGSEENPQGLSTRELDKGTIEANNTINEYTLKIWIAEDATNEAMDKVFNATLRVEGTQYVAPTSEYGEEIASVQLSENITATYYQPEESAGYNTSKVKRMSNVEKINNEETYEGGTLVISGEGDMPDAKEDEHCSSVHLFLGNVSTCDEFEELWDDNQQSYILKYNPTTLIIEEGVTKIGDFSFPCISSIASVSLPTTLKILGKNAFLETNFTNITLPEGLEIVEEQAFNGQNGLTSIRFPSSVTTIGESTHEEIRNVSTIYLGSNVTYIGGYAFYGLTSNSIIYCETQEVANLLNSSNYRSSRTTVIVDPTKFE